MNEPTGDPIRGAIDVFVSYSKEDKAVAFAVCAGLEARRIRCWIAPRDVPVGESWPKAIIDAISNTRTLVLVVSENANLSDHVMREVERAVSRGKPVLPMRIEDVPLREELEYYVGNAHWLDALTPPLEAHIARLADRLTGLLHPERLDPGPESAAPAHEWVRQPIQTRRRALAIGAMAASAGMLIWGVSRAWASPARPQDALAVTGEQPKPAVSPWNDPPPTAREPDRTRTPPTGAGSSADNAPRPSPGHSPAPLQAIEGAQPSQTPSQRQPTPRTPEALSNGLGMHFVEIRAAKFSMGTPAVHRWRIDKEPPPVPAEVGAHWMSTTPVTRRQFEAFVQATHYKTDAERGAASTVTGWKEGASEGTLDPSLSWKTPGFPQWPDHPVVFVTQADALQFCSWLSATDSRRYDLPSSAEFEWAAKAGTTSSWPWGEEPEQAQDHLNGLNPDTMRWYANPRLECFPFGDGFVHTSPVARFAANPWGLFDMHGNVWQWTKSPSRGDNMGRVAVRGGAFNTSISFTRSSYEGEQRASAASYRCGFRVVIRP